MTNSLSGVSPGRVSHVLDPPDYSSLSKQYPAAVVQLLSRVWLFATPWTAAWQASLSFTISRSLLKLMSIESMMSSKHLIFWHSLHLLPSFFPSIRVFSNELACCIRWSKYWRFSISPSNDAVVNLLRFVLLIIRCASQDTAILYPHLGTASLGHKFHCDANDSFTTQAALCCFHRKDSFPESPSDSTPYTGMLLGFLGVKMCAQWEKISASIHVKNY